MKWLATPVALLAFCASVSLADTHTTGVPQLNSRPGAAYTVYLDVAGFNYNGTWSGKTPGSTPALADLASNSIFDASQQTEIKNIWSRMAQTYIGFNVNVTTVDPAIAAGQSSTDSLRQAFYDATPNLMHTVVGSQVRPVGTPNTTPNNKWYSDGADGVSGLGIVAGVAVTSGDHTNWMFTEAQQGPGFINGDYIGSISAHENAHAFGLTHQGDWTGSTLVNEYSNGDANPGNGSYVPAVGNSFDRQRLAWRIGNAHTVNAPEIVNDVKAMLLINNAAFADNAGRIGVANLHLIEDGIGHTRPTATPLSLSGNTIIPSAAKGVIVPLSEANPAAIGAANYTEDWFSFSSTGSLITLICTDGTNFLDPTTSDSVGMLRSSLKIYDANGLLVASGIEDASTLFETYTGTLPAGTYYAQIGSFGGHAQDSPDFNSASYFDMGAYFLSGSGFAPVPEPGALSLLLMCGIALARRRRHAA